MRLLFVCGRNKRRSPTAEVVLAEVAGVETESAGVSADAENPLTDELVEWAEVIFVMEASQRTKMARSFGSRLRGKRVVCLNIPDKYAFMDAELVRLVWERVGRVVPAVRAGRPTRAEDEV
jgi:predicted protein tyrosine phosphatase